MKKRIDQKFFWFLLGTLIFISLTLSNILSYKKEESKLLNIHKQRIADYCKLLRYDISLHVDRTGNIQSALDIFDSHALVHGFIDHILVTEEGRITVSTDRVLAGESGKELPFINFDDFRMQQSPDFSRYIKLTLTRHSDNHEYDIFIKLNRDYIYKDIKETMNEHIYYIIYGVAIIFLIVFWLIERFVMEPIKTINKKISRKDLTHSHFMIEELDAIDHTIIDSFAELDKNSILLDSIINAADDLIFYKDKELRYVGGNLSFSKLVGCSREELIGRTDFDLFDDEHAVFFRRMDQKILAEGKINANYEWVEYPDGTKAYYHTQKIPFRYPDGTVGILGISRNLTDLHLAQEKITSMIYIDELTGLLNRKSFNIKAHEAIEADHRKAIRSTLIMYDIDDFKAINDQYGHQEGDKVLREMSELVKNIIREDDHAFRLGGEEFAILTTQDIDAADKLASRVLSAIREHRMIEGRQVTVSMGVTAIRYDDTFDTLYKRVDDLLYEAKRSGKNTIVSG